MEVESCTIVFTGRHFLFTQNFIHREFIHLFKHFCHWMHRSSTTHSEKSNRRNFRVWNSHGLRGHLTMAIPDAAFRRFGSVASTIGFVSDSYASCTLKWIFMTESIMDVHLSLSFIGCQWTIIIDGTCDVFS